LGALGVWTPRAPEYAVQISQLELESHEAINAMAIQIRTA
jgi:hypothetical protein